MVEPNAQDIAAARTWMQKAKADGMIRRGNDNDLPTVQAFARHRTEATAALEERVKLLEAVAGYARHNGLCGIVGGYDVCTCGLDAARDALNDPR